MLREAFTFMDSFYWNASLVVDCALEVELVSNSDRVNLFDAVSGLELVTGPI
jgi:hypothetical protein